MSSFLRFASAVFVVASLLATGGCNCSGTKVEPPDALIEEPVFSVRPDAVSLAVGESAELLAFLDEEDVTGTSTWTSSGAEVELSGGTVTARSVGEVTVTAQHGERSATSVVTVVEARLLSVEVLPGTATAPVGRSVTFSARGTFTDGTVRDLSSGVVWTSSAPAIASISSGGVALGLAVGAAQVTAAVGEVTSPPASFEVTSAVVAEVAVSPSTATIARGQTQAFTATATLSDGSSRDATAEATWSSSAPSVATVAEGTATGHSVGAAEITASVDGVLSPPAMLQVGAAVVTALAVTPDPVSLPLGTTVSFTATATYSDGSSGDVTAASSWSSSDSLVVTVNAAGLATATGIGSANVSASLDSISSPDVQVTVTAAEITSIALSPSAASVAKGRTQAFVATATFTDGTDSDITATATWSSSAPAVAQVSAGAAIGLTVGTAAITASRDGITSAPASFSVTAAVVDSVSVTPPTAQVAKGRTQQFIARATWSDGGVTDESATATWASSAPTVATVDASGLSSTLAEGTASITATFAGVTSPPALLTVTAPVLDLVTVTPATASVAKGWTQAFVATATWSDASTQDVTASATWSSSAPAVAPVNAGVAMGLAVGTANLTAAWGGVTSSAAVLTVDPAVVTALAVTPSSASIAEGQTRAFVATATWSDASQTDVSGVATWVSSDPTVATIAAGTATGVGVGIAQLVASHGGVDADPVDLAVTPATLVSISLSPRGGLLVVGDSLQLTATGTRTDGTTVDVTQVATWTSDVASVASVSQGQVSGVSAGTVLVIASTAGVGSTPVTVVVSTTALQSIAVTPASATIPLGLTQQYAATGTFADGTTAVLTQVVAWAAALPAVATVNNDGLALSAGVGTTDITASVGGITSPAASLTVAPAAVTTVALAPSSASIAKGRNQAFVATASYTDGSFADVSALASWASDDLSVAGVDGAGVATGMGVGTAGITATFSGVSSASGLLTVTAAELDLLVVAPSAASIAKGRTQAFVATGIYSDASEVDFTAAATWTSSAPLVADLTGAGSFQALTTGTAAITAQHLGLTSNSASLQVTPAVIDSIALSPPGLSLPSGKTGQLTATATWSDGANTDVTSTSTWASDSAHATVAAGLVSAVSVGFAQVTASGGGVTSPAAQVAITAAVIDAIALSPSSLSLAKGRTGQLTATAAWSDGTFTDITATAAWSSDSANASVAAGLVFAASVGTAEVFASQGGVTSPAAQVAVTPAVIDSIALNPSSLSRPMGKTGQLTASATWSDGSVTDVTASSTWASDSPNATVSAGLVTGVSVGTAQVTASVGGVTSSTATVEVTAAVIDSIALSPSGLSLPSGKTGQLTATATWSDGSVTDVTASATWASDSANASVAAGLVTAVSVGTARVSASQGGVTSPAAQVEVTPAVIDSIALNPSSLSRPVGKTGQLSASATWSDGSVTDVTASSTWASGSPNASVSAGLVTAVSMGTAQVTASRDGITSAPAAITVTAPVVDAVTVTPATSSVAKGRTVQFTASASWSDGTVTDESASAGWASSAPAIATVDGVGLASAHGEGTASITATFSGVTSPGALLTVTAPVLDQVSVTPAVSSVANGRTRQLTATATWSDLSTQDVTATSTWASSAPAIASVSASGLATGLSLGEASITATFGGVTSAGAALTVTAPVVDAVAASPSTASVPHGRTRQFTASVTWSDGSVSDETAASTWASSTPAVATVDGSGLASTGAQGSASITATFSGVTSPAAVLTVTAPVLDSVALSPSSASAAKGRTVQFTASASWSDGSVTEVSASAAWASSAPGVASVNGAGLASALTQGQASITATYSGVTSPGALLTVTAPELESITVSPVNSQVAVSFSRQFSASGYWSDGTISDVTSQVGWTSGNAPVASINSSGLATGLLPGQSAITATAPGIGGATASTQLTVTSATLSSITVTPNTRRLPTGGVKLALTATGFFSNGTSMDLTQSATWTSNLPAVALVSDLAPQKGIVTSGTAATPTAVSITATRDGVSGVAVITVTPATLSSISVSPTNATLPAGYTLAFKAAGTYSDGRIYDLTLTAAWTSSNPAVATISNTFPRNGEVTGVGSGSTTLFAAHAGHTGATQLTVTGATLLSLSLNPSTLSRAVGLTVQYSLVGVFSDGVTVDLTARALWSSSNPQVATVSTAAGSAGFASVVGGGTTTISATFEGLTATSSLTGTTPSLTGVFITPVGASVPIDGFVQMHATATFSDGSAADVTSLATWTTSNASVAVTRNDAPFQGMVVGAGGGVAIITATYGLFSGSRSLTVTTANLAEMYISPAMQRIGLNTTVSFKLSGVWSDGSTADLTEVANWSSSSPGVAQISNSSGSRGLATGVSGGSTTASATYLGISDSTVLTVTASPLMAINVTPALRSVPLGSEVQYTATAAYADGTLQNLTTQVGWISSDSQVAAISNSTGTKGLATGVGGGITTISAQFGSVSGSTSLEVRSVSLSSLTLTPVGATIPVGYFRQYTLVGTFSDGSSEDLTAQASWNTGDNTIAVAGNSSGTRGRVSALAVGSTTVSASVFGEWISTAVEVVALRLCSIEVTPGDQTLQVGSSLQMVATGAFAATCPAIPPTLTLDITAQVVWRVVPKQRVTVSNTAGSEGLVTAITAGSPAFGNIQAHREVAGVIINGGTKVYTTP